MEDGRGKVYVGERQRNSTPPVRTQRSSKHPSPTLHRFWPSVCVCMCVNVCVSVCICMCVCVCVCVEECTLLSYISQTLVLSFSRTLVVTKVPIKCESDGFGTNTKGSCLPNWKWNCASRSVCVCVCECECECECFSVLRVRRSYRCTRMRGMFFVSLYSSFLCPDCSLFPSHATPLHCSSTSILVHVTALHPLLLAVIHSLPPATPGRTHTER
jgi:hypothetical protein